MGRAKSSRKRRVGADTTRRFAWDPFDAAQGTQATLQANDAAGGASAFAKAAADKGGHICNSAKRSQFLGVPWLVD